MMKIQKRLKYSTRTIISNISKAFEIVQAKIRDYEVTYLRNFVYNHENIFSSEATL